MEEEIKMLLERAKSNLKRVADNSESDDDRMYSIGLYRGQEIAYRNILSYFNN